VEVKYGEYLLFCSAFPPTPMLFSFPLCFLPPPFVSLADDARGCDACGRFGLRRKQPVVLRGNDGAPHSHPRHPFSKVLYFVTLCSKCTRALIFLIFLICFWFLLILWQAPTAPSTPQPSAPTSSSPTPLVKSSTGHNLITTLLLLPPPQQQQRAPRGGRSGAALRYASIDRSH
jgi:hypothetical protein